MAKRPRDPCVPAQARSLKPHGAAPVGRVMIGGDMKPKEKPSPVVLPKPPQPKPPEPWEPARLPRSPEPPQPPDPVG